MLEIRSLPCAQQDHNRSPTDTAEKEGSVFNRVFHVVDKEEKQNPYSKEGPGGSGPSVSSGLRAESSRITSQHLDV